MELVFENTTDKHFVRPVYLICAFRDEAILLPYFIDYYNSLGVSHFIFIDNLSSDNGSSYLKSRKDINLRLFYETESYRQARYGKSWINYCMQQYCWNQYCLCVDADELFIFNSNRYSSLYDLIDEMEKNDQTVVAATLLDIYPETINDNYRAGQPFSEHSHYFDRWNEQYYKKVKTIYKKFFWLKGGLRARTLNTENIIHKFPLMKSIFNEKTVVPDPHFFRFGNQIFYDAPKVRLTDYPAILLHYKFIKPDFVSYLEKQVSANEHWNNSQEYKNYLAALKINRQISFFDKTYSQQLINIAELDDFWNQGSEYINSRPS